MEVAAEPLIGLTREKLYELLRLSLDHLFEGETETAGGGGARQFFRRYVSRRKQGPVSPFVQMFFVGVSETG